ncbi:alkaline ceramidase ydc1 [Tilletia horrida]|nr:alkaline ceramidase ydc1 [Tilletia horrida]KAK0564432.1 alkaline ceramidase ydc1 [Tilletia horrida]
MSWYIDPVMPKGYWGEVTATLVWCEEKYQWSKYLAEPVNSISNIMFLALATFGVHWTIKARLPIAFVGCFLGIGLIGMGSFLFHATLLWSMQACDELPMIYTTCIFSWAVFQAGQPRQFRLILPFLIFAFIGGYTALYFLNKENTLLHQLTYAALQISSTLRVYNLLSSSPTSALSQKGGSQALVRAQISKLYWTSVACFVAGFTAWNIDNIWCQTLRHTRRTVLGPVFGVLLEGHAWWHLLTGYGAYAAGLAGAFLIGSIEESPDTFKLAHAGPFKVPYLVRGKPDSADIIKNGKAQ